MATLIKVPRLGWSMDEGTFGEWLIGHGDQVKPGDMLFVLEGDKASQDIESFDEGILHIPPSAPGPGDKVFVGQPLGFLLAEGESAPPLPDFSSAENEVPNRDLEPPKTIGAERPAGPAARRLARELGINLDQVETNDPTERVTRYDLQNQRNSSQPVSGSRHLASPRARRKASELGVALDALKGTGKNGRIRERDVIAAGIIKGEEFVPVASGKWVEPTRLRFSIANRLSQSHSQCVPVTLNVKANAQHLVDERQVLKSHSPENIPGYNDILLHHVAQSLAKNPELNCCWCNNKLFQFDDINIGFAVDTEAGLLAPVIEQADTKQISEIAICSRDLARRARAGQLSEKELSVGTFTISNLGMLGVDHFTPVVNFPQCAILGIGRIVEEPVVVDGKLCVGKTISFSLTFDHRAVDGAPAAKWLQQFCARVEGS